MIRIFVIDDHPIVREGLASLLADDEEFEVVGTAGSAEDALAPVRRLRPDVILLDLELPGIGGVRAISPLAEAHAGARVIVFTAYRADEHILAALRAGARGYLLKGAPAADIRSAIRAVHAGESYLESGAAATVIEAIRAPARRDTLSARERDVLRLVAAGRANKEIAAALSISERTVKFHVTSIMNKLGAANRAAAAALAVEKGLL